MKIQINTDEKLVWPIENTKVDELTAFLKAHNLDEYGISPYSFYAVPSPSSFDSSGEISLLTQAEPSEWQNLDAQTQNALHPNQEVK